MRAPHDPPALAVLRCSACGVPLVLREGDAATCSQCGRQSEIPAEHRALRDATRWDDAARDAAERALHGFDAPPGLLLRALAFAARVPFWVIFMALGAPLFFMALGLVWPLAQRIAGALGWPTGDQVSSALVVALMGLVFWALAIVPSFLVTYGGRRVSARALLMAALAAKRPEHPGGPSSCRSCGAPLELRPGAHVARCTYCRTESVLVVDPGHLRVARGATSRLVQTMEEAAVLDLGERQATRAQVRRRLWRATWKTAVPVALWTYMQHGFEVASRTETEPGGAILAGVVLVGFLIYLIASSGSDGET